jgi:hypothetical protein
LKENIKSPAIFYGLSIPMALLTGKLYGFTAAHTPPLPFVIALLTMAASVIWIIIDLALFFLKHKPFFWRLTIHFLALVLNGLIIAYVFYL